MAEHPTPVVSGSAVGIIPNPMSGRDIRRVVAQASVFPNTEKTSMVLRIVRAVGALGVERVLLSTDAFGIAAGVLREVRRLRAAPPSARVRLPEIEFLTLQRPTGSATDTTEYARMIAQRCSSAVVLLGGDGTVRAAAPGLGDTPMLPLSTGTNNAFPIMMEATVAGMALGLIATGRAHAPMPRAKVLHVDVAKADGTWRHEIALVDVCVNTIGEIGSRAVWKTDTLRELYCTFAEPGAIGLSSIPGRIMPTGRGAPNGVAVLIGTMVARRAPCSPRSRRDCWSRSGSTAASPCDPASPATSGSHGAPSRSTANASSSSVQVTGSASRWPPTVPA